MSEYESTEKKIYQITHRETGEKRIVASIAAQNACAGLGWMIGDCHVYEVTPEMHSVEPFKTALCVKVPCNICSFQWSECKLQHGCQCPCSPTTPDVQEWTRQAMKAHLCTHIGIALFKKDYYMHQKWLPLEEAVRELAVK